MNYRSIVLLGAVLSGLAVAIGAFGAHALEAVLKANERTATFATASQYHFYHALGILFIGILAAYDPQRMYHWAAWLMAGGVLIFSGTLYALSITNLRWLGAITPIGGVLFIAAWAMAAFAAWQSMRESS